MNLRDLLLPEYNMEMAKTRTVLERAPEDRLAWAPHPKSFTLQALLCHVANIPGWIPMTIEQDALDMAPAGQEPWKTPQFDQRDLWLAAFDANVAAGRASLEKLDDAAAGRIWTLLAGGKALFSAPRSAVLRGFVFSHLVHHRAQLAVYLRLLDVPVPAIYGPSADETMM